MAKKKYVLHSNSLNDNDILNMPLNDEKSFFVEEEVPYEEETPKREFFLSGLSIDEKRLSALILCLIVTILFGGYNYVISGDISSNLTNIITTLIYAITGVNITNSIMDKWHRPKDNDMVVHTREEKKLVCKKDDDQ